MNCDSCKHLACYHWGIQFSIKCSKSYVGAEGKLDPKHPACNGEGYEPKEVQHA
jgi:hypothetical protein